MGNRTFTIENLRLLLHEAAGEADGIDSEGDILDTEFDAMGYDSLALLEVGSRIEREYGITLEDSAMIEAGTPRSLLTVVNAQLDATGAL